MCPDKPFISTLCGYKAKKHTCNVFSKYVCYRDFTIGVQTISKVTPTAPVTKSAAIKKKKRTGKAKKPGQWKHEEAPLDEM